MAKHSPSSANPSAILDDASKGPGLLFGTLLFLAIFGLAESIAMIWSGRRLGLVGLLVFALLAADAIILMIALRQPAGRDAGWLRLIAVWILGLIPYFVWVVIYGAGKGIASLLERQGRSNPRLIAFLVWIAVVLLCLYTYIGASPAVHP